MALVLSRFKFPVVREQYALPDTVEGIAHKVQSILEGGSVQSLEMSVDKSVITVYRAVTSPEETELENISARLRNVELVEYLSKKPGVSKIAGMFAMLDIRGLSPSCFIVGNHKPLLDLLEIPDFALTSNVLGIPVVRLKDLNDDVLILCGSSNSTCGADDIELAIKTDIVLEDSNERTDKNADRIGFDPKISGGAVGTVEESTRGSLEFGGPPEMSGGAVEE